MRSLQSSNRGHEPSPPDRSSYSPTSRLPVQPRQPLRNLDVQLASSLVHVAMSRSQPDRPTGRGMLRRSRREAHYQMGVRRGNRVEYVGEAFWVGPDDEDWIRPGHRVTVISLEPPDDAPIVSFDEFWSLVERCLRPEGRVFFLDEGRHEHWREEHIDSAVPLVRRRLRDGSEHNVVKVFWDAKQLEDKLTAIGWKVAIQTAGPLYWGRGSPGTSE